MREPRRSFAPKHFDKHDLYQAREDRLAPWPHISGLLSNEGNQPAKPHGNVVRSTHMNKPGKEFEEEVSICRVTNDPATRNPRGGLLPGIAKSQLAGD